MTTTSSNFNPPVTPLRALDYAIAIGVMGWKYDKTKDPSPETDPKPWINPRGRDRSDADVPMFTRDGEAMLSLMVEMQRRGRLIEVGNDVSSFTARQAEDEFLCHEYLWEAGFTDGRADLGGSPIVASNGAPLSVAIAVALSYGIDVDSILKGAQSYIVTRVG